MSASNIDALSAFNALMARTMNDEEAVPRRHGEFIAVVEHQSILGVGGHELVGPESWNRWCAATAAMAARSPGTVSMTTPRCVRQGDVV